MHTKLLSRVCTKIHVLTSTNSHTSKYNIIHYHYWIGIPKISFKMNDGGLKRQQTAHGMYLRSPNSGLATTIYFYHIRQTFHSPTGTRYSGYARTALSKSYKIQATLSSIPHSLPPFLSSPPSSTPHYCDLLCRHCPHHWTLPYASYNWVSHFTLQMLNIAPDLNACVPRSAYELDATIVDEAGVQPLVIKAHTSFWLWYDS